jgi:restriction system protein
MTSRSDLLTRPIWVMRDGTDGQAHDDFARKGRISLESPDVGDLRLLLNDRKLFFEQYRRAYPSASSASAGIKSGELYRFCHQLNWKDVVVCPSRTDGIVRFGRVARVRYRYLIKSNPGHPHTKQVNWFNEDKRKTLPAGVRRAISGRLALYQPSKDAKSLRSFITRSKHPKKVRP